MALITLIYRLKGVESLPEALNGLAIHGNGMVYLTKPPQIDIECKMPDAEKVEKILNDLNIKFMPPKVKREYTPSYKCRKCGYKTDIEKELDKLSITYRGRTVNIHMCRMCVKDTFDFMNFF